MKGRRSALLLCVCLFTASLSGVNGSPGSEWTFPGEYESHQAIWMMWPTFEYKAGFSSTEPIADMIRATRGHVQVNLGVQDSADESDARRILRAHGVALDHVHFFHIEHGDIWARDMGPQFTRDASGNLRINDWNFNMWGYEEPESDLSILEEQVDRAVAAAIDVPVLDTRAGPQTGVRMIHEGGSASHNGHGTMIAVESVVIQRNLGPNRFCGGQAPVTDYDQPNTYAPDPDWPACKALVEREYRRMLGVRKVIWIPTGVIEDNGTFRGRLATHIQVPSFNGIDIPHTGVYTLFTTNGHPDEVVRFVGPAKVVLAQETLPDAPAITPVEQLLHWLREQNHQRLERVFDIISAATTESGERIEIVRIPMPELTLDVFQPGDGQHDYFSVYDRWEDGSTLPEVMLAVWPASYVNYAPTNDLVLVPRFWKPGRPIESKEKDRKARNVLKNLFPGREIAQVHIENVVRGGGGMNCITQQQPASGRFVRRCGWAKVKVDVETTALYVHSTGRATLGSVPRLTRSGDDVYLKRLFSSDRRVQVRVVGDGGLDGEVGWVDEDDIESAGEKCPNVYSPS